MTAAAELVADGGAGAEEEDFFRSRPFYDAEGVTHTLRIETGVGTIVVPVIVREIPGTDFLDGISPYGYPGAAVRDEGKRESGGAGDGGVVPLPAEVDWSGLRLVSLFLRDRLGVEPFLRGATRRSVVQVADPGLPRKSRMSDRQQMRRNQAAGYRIERVRGPESSADQRRGFKEVYLDSMRRAGAAERYLFGGEYFERTLQSPRTWLFLVGAPDSGTAAAALATLSDGILHYYLSGTSDEHLRSSPAKNLISAVIDFAEQLGVPMNLGGGVRPGDNLEAFKKGFANRELPFHTHEIVCDPAAYRQLGGGREDAGFFPLYRAPGSTPKLRPS